MVLKIKLIKRILAAQFLWNKTRAILFIYLLEQSSGWILNYHWGLLTSDRSAEIKTILLHMMLAYIAPGTALQTNHCHRNLLNRYS